MDRNSSDVANGKIIVTKYLWKQTLDDGFKPFTKTTYQQNDEKPQNKIKSFQKIEDFDGKFIT